MSQVNFTTLSKTISHALRHDPSRYEITLDDEGWTPISALLDGLQKVKPHWKISHADLEKLLDQPGKKRYQIQGNRIRALYGHSIPARIHKTAVTPPAKLFHGTSPAAADIIRKSGIKPMSRQFVHLSADRKTAVLVGQRKAPQPVILIVHAAAAAQAGICFYDANDNTWLADFIPPEFIDG